jgi:hypothetical protein
MTENERERRMMIMKRRKKRKGRWDWRTRKRALRKSCDDRTFCGVIRRWMLGKVGASARVKQKSGVEKFGFTSVGLLRE